MQLGENVALEPPPPLPGDDRAAMKEKLLRLEEKRGEISARPNDAAARFAFAKEAARVEDRLSSREALLAGLRLEPQAGLTVEEALGRCQIQLGLYADALRTYQHLVSLAPNAAPPYIGLNRAQRFLEKREEAAQTLERAARAVPPSDIAGRMKLALEFDQLGDLRRALAEAQAIQAIAPEEPNVSLVVGRLLFKVERLEEARAVLEKLIAAHPENAPAQHYLAAVLSNPLSPRRDLAQAEHHFLEAIQRSPREPAAYAALGELYQEQGRSRQAAYVYTQLLNLTPDSAAGRLQLARAYARLGDSRTSAEQEQVAQRLLARGKVEAALLVRRDQRPADPQRRRALARHYVESGQFGRALAELQTAYALTRGAPDVRQELITLYAKIGVAPPPPVTKGGWQ